MNLDVVTIRDCVEKKVFMGFSVVINDGNVTGFVSEKFPTLVVSRRRECIGKIENIYKSIIYG